MLRAGNGSLARAKAPKEHGRHIFAYCHVKTNQVLYSLTQTLSGRSLKELSDAGANNNPPKLRKDLWRPLWSVTMPDGHAGAVQGLAAYRMLRDYRKLHEMNWESPPELARHYTQEEIDEIKEELDERGGSKIETPYDVIKKRKKNLRARMVMDQKANSVADLAAVLKDQAEKGVKNAEKKETALEEHRAAEVTEMLALAKEADEGGFERLDAEISSLRARIQAKKEGNRNEEASNRGMTRAIHALEKQKRKMEFSANAVAAADEGYTWLPNNNMTPSQMDRHVQEQNRLLKPRLQAARDVGAVVGIGPELSNVQPADGQASEEGISEATPDGEPTPSEAPQAPPPFKLRRKEQALELEMIRRLHNSPSRVAEALEAYKPTRRDIRRLRALARHWEMIFPQLLARLEARLGPLRALQDAVYNGESATMKWFLSREQDRYPRTETGQLDFEAMQRNTPHRAKLITALDARVAFLRDFMPLMTESHSVEEMQLQIQAFQAAHPNQKPEFSLSRNARGSLSQLKVVAPDRMFALALAKTKIEARVAELESALGVKREAAHEEDARDDGEEILEAIAEEEGSAEPEQLAEPSMEELHEAIKQIRRLSPRIKDIDNVDAFRAVAEKLSTGEVLAEEPKAAWVDLDLAEKTQRYSEYVAELERSRVPLQRARALLTEHDGLERLHKAADSARERSVAARSIGEEQVALEQKIAAKIYERVAKLRESEDLVLRAPEEAADERAETKETPEQTVAEGAEAAETSARPEASAPTQDAHDARDAQEGEQGTGEEVEASAPPPVDYHAILPSFPEKTTLPKKKSAREGILLRRKAIFTTEGVVVKWNSMLDAEYAPEWPENVQHEPMGLYRHTAPRPTQTHFYDVAEFKNQPGGGYRGKRWEREMEKKEVRERVKGVTESVLEAVRRREATVVKERVEAKKAEREEKRTAAIKQARLREKREAEERAAAVEAAIGEVQDGGEGGEKPVQR